MPAGSGDDKSPLRGEVLCGEKRFFNFIQDLSLEALSFAVYPVKLQCGPFGLAGNAAVRAVSAMSHPSLPEALNLGAILKARSAP